MRFFVFPLLKSNGVLYSMGTLPIKPPGLPNWTPTGTPTTVGPIKPGYKTTEWWVTLGTFLVAGFVLTGVISQDKQDTLSQIMTHAILSVGSVGAVATSAWKYIKSRNEQKIAQINANPTTPPVVATIPPIEPAAEIPKPAKKPRKTTKKKTPVKTTKRKRKNND